MNERVKEFLSAKEEEKKKWHDEEKYKILTEAGLFDKICVENDPNDDEIFTEYDPENQCQSYYKMIPIDVTDEEYEEIKKVSKEMIKCEEPKSNVIATILKVVGIIIFILGFISGLVIGENSFALTFAFWVASFINGMMFLSLAEIISLLNDIKNK